MRIQALSSLLVIAACGGGPKHAAIDPSDTASLEPAGGSTSSEPSGGSSSGGVAETTSGSGGSSGGAGPLAAMSASASTDSTPPVAFHPAPGATGFIDGKPFAPKLAQVVGPLQKDGRLLVILHEGSDCIVPADAKPGDGAMSLLITWQNGYQVDLGSLLRPKGHDKGEASFVRFGADKKGHVSTTFKPTGKLTVVSAPKDANAFGKLKIDLSSGDYILAGDLDVKVCGALK